MSDSIPFTCPRCKYQWNVSLDDLETESVIRKKPDKPQDKVSRYRAQCPRDGTYVIVEVEED